MSKAKGVYRKCHIVIYTGIITTIDNIKSYIWP